MVHLTDINGAGALSNLEPFTIIIKSEKQGQSDSKQ